MSESKKKRKKKLDDVMLKVQAFHHFAYKNVRRMTGDERTRWKAITWMELRESEFWATHSMEMRCHQQVC